MLKRKSIFRRNFRTAAKRTKNSTCTLDLTMIFTSDINDNGSVTQFYAFHKFLHEETELQFQNLKNINSFILSSCRLVLTSKTTHHC